MILLITLNYHTQWGENLVFCNGKKRKALTYTENDIWSARIDRIAQNETYHYEVERDGQVLRREWQEHRLPKVTGIRVLHILDRWNDIPQDQPFHTAVFTRSIFGRKPEHIALDNKKLIVETRCAVVHPDETLALVGGHPDLGSWSAPVPMDDCDFPLWKGGLPAEIGVEYKFVIADKKTLAIKAWESGENRWISEMPAAKESLMLVEPAPLFPDRRWRGAGTAIPVFSLRTEDGFGTGEFNDLRLFVDWAAMTGQRIIQLLPINDTTMTGTWEDSYPYNANSTFALHPQFLNLPLAGYKEDEEYRRLKTELNALPQVDYERVNLEKNRLLHKLYQRIGKKTAATKAYKQYLEENKNWLLPYAVFCCLRDDSGTVDFSRWKSFSRFTRKKMENYVAAHPDQVGFWCFVQYQLHVQMRGVAEYAHSKGVVLKGDLPIGISRTSVDAWIHPELFHMNSQAGAPPDAFSADGQNWGFPTYNWEAMAQDGFSWWKSRLKVMSRYFDAFRIDHILGFFRIWEIPLGIKTGLLGHFNPALPYPEEELRSKGFDMRNDRLVMRDAGPDQNADVIFIEDPEKKGYFHPRIAAHYTQAYQQLEGWQKENFNRLYDDFFYHRHNAFWKDSALSKLPSLLTATDMLACGEDLGMIPDSVPEVMSDLRILSLEIQRMPKSVTELFGDPAHYPYHCVCTTSTHDMNPIRAWWREDRPVTDRFWHEFLGEWGDTPRDCTPDISARILWMHLASPAMFTILPLQDWLAMDECLRFDDPEKERINIPAIPRHYWRYRMHLKVEDLLLQTGFNQRVRDMIAASGRE